MKKSILKKSLIAIVTVVVIYAVGYIYNNSSNVSSIIDDDSVIPTTVPASESEISGEPQDHSALGGYDVLIADRGNNRIIEVTPDKKIVCQYGVTGECKDAPGYLNAPNGDTPLPNGHVLISNIRNHKVIELDENWKQVFSLSVPLAYPSDPQETKAGNILIADYVK